MPARADGLIHLRPRIPGFAPTRMQESEDRSQIVTNRPSTNVLSRKWSAPPDLRHDAQDRRSNLHQPQLKSTNTSKKSELSVDGPPVSGLNRNAALRRAISPNKPGNPRPTNIPDHSKIPQDSTVVIKSSPVARYFRESQSKEPKRNGRARTMERARMSQRPRRPRSKDTSLKPATAPVAEDTSMPSLSKPAHSARHIVDVPTPKRNSPDSVPISAETFWYCERCQEDPIRPWHRSCPTCGHRKCNTCPTETIRNNKNASIFQRKHVPSEEELGRRLRGINKKRGRSRSKVGMSHHADVVVERPEKSPVTAEVDHASSPEQLPLGDPEQPEQSHATIPLRNILSRPSQEHTNKESSSLYMSYTISQDHTTDTASRQTAMLVAIQDRCKLYPVKSEAESSLKEKEEPLLKENEELVQSDGEGVERVQCASQ